MKTLMKVVAGLVALVVVLVVAAVVVLPMFFDPNDFKDEITAVVKENTGRELTISGDIGLTVFPWLGIDLGAVSLSNAQGFKAQSFASTEKVNIRVKLMPLLERRVEMDTVTVHGLALNLEKNQKGKTNWDDLASAGAKPKGEAKRVDGQGLAALAIGGLDVRQAALSWDDAQAGQRYQVSNLNVQTGAITLGKPVDLRADLQLEGGSPPVKGTVEARAKLSVDAAGKRYVLEGLEVKAKLEGEALPGGKTEAVLGANVELDGARQTLGVRDLALEAVGLVKVSGKLDATELDKKPRFAGDLKVTEFSPRALMKSLGQPAIETADSKVLSSASLDAKVSGTPERVSMKPLAVKLDDSTIEGEVSVANFAKPAISFDLALDAIDADRYLPPAGAQGDKTPPSPGTAAAGASGLPMETLRSLDVDGKLRAGKVKVAKLTITDVSAAVSAKNGLIRLSPVSAKLYEGAYAGNIALDARKDPPKLSVDEKLSGIQAGPLLEDLQGEDRLSGRGDVSVKVSAVGADADSVKRTLNGDAAFAFKDGALKGVDIGRMIREARAKLRGESLPAGDAGKKTDFSELTGTVKFKNGIATNDDLSAKSPLLRIEGKGTADLPGETVDYRIKTTVVATSQGQGGKELDDLAGIPIPVRVTGTFAAPEYGLDVEALGAALAKSKAKEVVDSQKEKVTEGLKDKLKGAGGDKAGGLLKGILKQ